MISTASSGSASSGLASSGLGPSGLGATSVREALEGAITAIAAAGSETPRLDAELLLADVLSVSREQLMIERELTVVGPAIRAFQTAVRRRAIEHEPIAYILGRRAFRRLELAVDHRALVPRPETELLVEVALRFAPGTSVLDLCTGGGAVALALKDERPDLLVSASDIDAAALALAGENARRLGLAVSWLEADLLEGVGEEFDAVLANPPYVAEGERQLLAPEIVRHEPSRALFAGADGLAVIRRLLEQLTPRTRVSTVALEVGDGQAEIVGDLLADAGFASVRAERDLAGIERVVIGERARVGESAHVGENAHVEENVGENAH